MTYLSSNLQSSGITNSTTYLIPTIPHTSNYDQKIEDIQKIIFTLNKYNESVFRYNDYFYNVSALFLRNGCPYDNLHFLYSDEEKCKKERADVTNLFLNPERVVDTVLSYNNRYISELPAQGGQLDQITSSSSSAPSTASNSLLSKTASSIAPYLNTKPSITSNTS